MDRNQLNFLQCSQKDYRGWHVMFDYHFVLSQIDETINRLLGNLIFQLMQDVCQRHHLNVVHRKLKILGPITPFGFTSVLLLDESHMTAHCYTTLGLLAIDVFSCGGQAQKTIETANDLHQMINQLQIDGLIQQIEVLRFDCPRFPYNHKKCLSKTTR